MSLFDVQKFLENEERKKSQPPITLPQANLTDPMEGQSPAGLLGEFVFGPSEPDPNAPDYRIGYAGDIGIGGIGSMKSAPNFLKSILGGGKSTKAPPSISTTLTKVSDDLPAPTTGSVLSKVDDLPAVKNPQTLSTAVRGAGTKGPKLIDAEVTDVPKKLTNAQKAALIGGTTFAATAPFVGDGGTGAETVASEEQKKALSNFYSDYLMTLPEADRGRAAAGIVAGLEARAQRESDRAEYEKNVAEMKAESEMKRLMKMAKQPGFKELVQAGIIGGGAGTSAANIDFMQLARDKGAEGSSVKAMADLMEAEFKREEAESKARTAPASPTMDKYDKAVALVNKLITDQPELAAVRDDLIRRALGLENLDKADTLEQILKGVQTGGSDSGEAGTDTLGLL